MLYLAIMRLPTFDVTVHEAEATRTAHQFRTQDAGTLETGLAFDKQHRPVAICVTGRTPYEAQERVERVAESSVYKHFLERWDRHVGQKQPFRIGDPPRALYFLPAQARWAG